MNTTTNIANSGVDPNHPRLRIAELKPRLDRIDNRIKLSFAVMFTCFVTAAAAAMLSRVGAFADQSTNALLVAASLAGIGAIAGVMAAVFANARSRWQTEMAVLQEKQRIESALGDRDLQAAAGPASYFDKLVQINVENLADYYGLVRIHTDKSFLLCVIAGSIGFGLIVIGIAIGFFHDDPNGRISYLSAAAGIVTELIAGVFFYLYNRTVRQLKRYHDSLLFVQNVLLSFKLVGDTKEEADRVKMVTQMLGYLLVAREKAPSKPAAKRAKTKRAAAVSVNAIP